MSHEDRQDRILLYALGTLDEEERRELEAHLAAGCDRCERELEAAQDLATDLALSVDQTSPPATARARLRDRLRDTATAPTPAATSGTAEADSAEATAAAAVSPSGPARAGARPVVAGRIGWRGPLLGGLIAAAIVGAVTAVPLYLQQQRLDQLDQELTAMRQTADQARSRVSELTMALDGAAGIVSSLQSNGVFFVSLKSPREDQQLSGRMLWDMNRNIGHLFASDLPPAEKGKTYRLWFATDENRLLPIQSFNVAQSGGGWYRFDLKLPDSLDPKSLRGVSVSYDPAEEEVEQPTHPVLAGEFYVK